VDYQEFPLEGRRTRVVSDRLADDPSPEIPDLRQAGIRSHVKLMQNAIDNGAQGYRFFHFFPFLSHCDHITMITGSNVKQKRIRYRIPTVLSILFFLDLQDLIIYAKRLVLTGSDVNGKADLRNISFFGESRKADPKIEIGSIGLIFLETSETEKQEKHLKN